MKRVILLIKCYLLFIFSICLSCFIYYEKDLKKKSDVELCVIENIGNDITDISKVTEEIKIKNYIVKESSNKAIDYVDDIVKYTKKNTRNNDDFLMMIGLYCVESKFNVNAISYLGARSGRSLGQVSEIGLTEYNWKNGTNYKPNDLFDIETNIKISCWLFYHYLDHYNFSINECIMAYNMGCSNVKKGNYNYKYLDKVVSEWKKI